MIHKRPAPKASTVERTAKVSEPAPARTDGRLRSFFDRWARLENAKAEIADGLKDLFGEAKGVGFEPKALRIAFRQKVKAENLTDADRETAALVELYLSGLEFSASASLARESAPARVENIHEFPLNKRADNGANIVTKRSGIAVPHDPVTGEIQESAAVLNRRGSTSTENVSDEISELNPVAKASEDNGRITGGAGPVPGEVSRPDAGRSASATSELKGETSPGGENPAPIPPVGAADGHSVIAEAGAAVAFAAPAEIPDADIPAFLKVGHRHPAMQTPASPRAEAIALRRPFCQHLNNWAKCAGHGDVHCSSCQKIADEARQ